MMNITCVAGKIGVPGLCVTDDPGGHEKSAKQGSLSLKFGPGWSKA
ncbi:hypothetical protein [Candidatus Pantoea deserta]|nr:hypothetical protein [Pantoea deserta]